MLLNPKTNKNVCSQLKEELITQLSHGRSTKTLSGKAMFQFAVAIAIFGYVLLVVSQIPVPVASEMKYTELSHFDRTQTTLSIRKTGGHYVNKTRGEVILNDSSRIKLYNDKEQLVFSLPLTSFPSQFAVDSTGYYVMILENVSLNDSAEFSVLEAEQQYVFLTSMAGLALPGGLVLTVGLAGVGLVLALKATQMSHEKEDYLKALKWNFSRTMCFLFGLLSAILIPLLAVGALSMASGGIVPGWSFVVWIATIVIVLVYWFKLREVADAFVSMYGYDGILLLERITLIDILALYAGMIALVITSVILPLQLTLIFTPIFMWVLILVMSMLLMLFPFITPFDYSAKASFALNEFLSNYRQHPDTVDFSLIKHASESTAKLLSSYNYQISSAELAEQLSIDLLAPPCDSLEGSGTGEDRLVQRLLKALDPIHAGELISVIKQVNRVEEAHEKRKIESMISCLGYIATIVGSIVYVLLILLGR